MEKNKKRSNGLLITIVILLFIVSGCLVFYTFRNAEEIKNLKKNKEAEINIDSNQNTTVKNDELNELERLGLFEKYVNMHDLVVIDQMLSYYNRDGYAFSDELILRVLYFMPGNSVSTGLDESGPFSKILIEDAQKLAQKYFGKTLDVNKLVASGNVKQENNYLIYGAITGAGTYYSDLIEVKSLGSGLYAIDFNYNGSGNLIDNQNEYVGYRLTVMYKDGNIVYKDIEKI